MNTVELAIPYPPGLADTLRTTREEAEALIRLMAALKLFELGKLASGKAAELSGLSRVDFIHACARYRVSLFNVPAGEAEAEIRRDLETARRLAAQ